MYVLIKQLINNLNQFPKHLNKQNLNCIVFILLIEFFFNYDIQYFIFNPCFDILPFHMKIKGEEFKLSLFLCSIYKSNFDKF